MALSYGQIKQLWIDNGGNPAAAGIAAAVALAESGGNPNAISKPNSNGTIDRGLFQINSIHGAQSTTDLITNVRAAIAISSNGTNWNPWTTFKTKAYLQFLNKNDSYMIGTSEVDIQGTPVDSNPLTGIAGAFVELVKTASNIVRAGTWLANPHNTTRIFLVITGGGLILVGVLILARGTIADAAQTIETTAKTAAMAAA